ISRSAVLASLQWPTPAGTTTTSPALTSSTSPDGPPKRTLAEPLATPSTSCASLWKWWNGCTWSRHAAGQRFAVNMRSIAAGSAGTACRYTNNGRAELGMAPSSAKVKVWGSVIAVSPLLNRADDQASQVLPRVSGPNEDSSHRNRSIRCAAPEPVPQHDQRRRLLS